jgi:hypothetical protein
MQPNPARLSPEMVLGTNPSWVGCAIQDRTFALNIMNYAFGSQVAVGRLRMDFIA